MKNGRCAINFEIYLLDILSYKGAFIVSGQTENAYRNLCIHKQDRHKLISNSASSCKHNRQHYEVCNVKKKFFSLLKLVHLIKTFSIITVCSQY